MRRPPSATLFPYTALFRSVARATDWVVGMRSEGGGWGAFDADNTHHHLNSIPFADHGALLDPPTADVSGRCLAMLAQDRKSTRLNSSHANISYAVFCLKKK